MEIKVQIKVQSMIAFDVLVYYVTLYLTMNIQIPTIIRLSKQIRAMIEEFALFLFMAKLSQIMYAEKYTVQSVKGFPFVA